MWKSKFVGVAVYEGCSVWGLQCLRVVVFISCGALRLLIVEVAVYVTSSVREL